MKITIINQYYPPDLSPTGMLAASLAEHRIAQEDHVTVIAGEGYANTVGHSREKSDIDESSLPYDDSSPWLFPRIRRIWTPRLGRKSIWRRVTDYFVYFVLTIWVAIRLPKQDLIVCLSTPPFIAIAGVLHKLLHPKTRLILWNMDCYPEMAERTGVIRKNGVMSQLMQFANRILDSSLDHTICLDNAMQDLILSRRFNSSKPKALRDANGDLAAHDVGEPSIPLKSSMNLSLSVVSNWEPSIFFPRKKVQQEKHRRRSDELLVLYSGNMGLGHCFDTTVDSAQQLHSQDARVRFVFTGGGGQRWRIRQDVMERQLKNVDFLGYVPIDQLRELQRSAGCSLITLKDEMLGVMSPSKLHGSLAMGLPILYVGPQGSNVDEAIETYNCGVSLRYGDTKGFIDFVSLLQSDESAREGYSERARRAFETEYCDDRALPVFDRIIASLFSSIENSSLVNPASRGVDLEAFEHTTNQQPEAEATA